MHAFEEIFLNALQEAGGQGPVSVRASVANDNGSRPSRVTLGFSAPGEGFAPDVAAHATEPFFTTRNTGVGLGLTVACRIVENHAGVLEIRTRSSDDATDVLLHLPTA